MNCKTGVFRNFWILTKYAYSGKPENLHISDPEPPKLFTGKGRLLFICPDTVRGIEMALMRTELAPGYQSGCIPANQRNNAGFAFYGVSGQKQTMVAIKHYLYYYSAFRHNRV
jgi:hypothetical protein